jgi:cobalt-precorrin-5B (C1)-methyltransferase
LGGEEIARRTFNPRLGIEGGISILGTTGVVEPKSMLSFRASIEVYVRVAMGEMAPEIVLTPGNLGQRFARSELDLPTHRVVQMSNFVGFALGCVTECVRERGERLRRLWVVGHPGKLCKVLADVWDTHSSGGPSAMDALRSARFALLENGAFALVASVEELIVAMAGVEPKVRDAFWRSVCVRIAACVGARTEGVEEVRVVLFGLDGSRLGEGGWLGN